MKRESRVHGALAVLLIASSVRSGWAAEPAAPPRPTADAPKETAPSKPAAEAPKETAPAKAEAPKDEAARAGEARALFKEGRTLAQKGDWEGACSKFQASLDLEPGVGTQFNLADCLEHRGRTASARSLFLEVAERARASGQGDRERVARARAAQLEGRVPNLVIEVAYPARQQEVRRDGVVLPVAAWGSALSIDPGSSVISATAPGKESWSTRIDIPATAGLVTVLVPRLADMKEAPPVVPAPAPPRAAPKAKAAALAAEPAPPEPKRKSNVLPIVLLAGAGAGAVVGAASFVLYKRSNDEAEAVCPSSVGCSPAQIRQHDDLTSDARTMRTVGFIGVGVAGAALITAGVLAITGRGNRENPAPPVSASAFLGREGFSAGVTGRF